MPDLVSKIAFRLLEGPIDPVPRYRLLRDILLWPEDHPDLESAREMAMQSSQVKELCQTQLSDGSWGRFYTTNKYVQYAARTTETAVIRANALGMDHNHPCVRRAIGYLESILAGKVVWPEKPDPVLDWPAGTELITAACLSLLDPNNPALDPVVEKWKDIMASAFVHETFDSVRYQESFENCCHMHMEHGPKMGFSSYSLILLRNRLPYELESRMIKLLIEHSRGIFLINNRSLNYLPLKFPSMESLRFINALDLLSNYPSAADLLQKATDWLWEHMNNEGCWDLGMIGKDGLELPLSESWRTQGNREIDSTVRILSLLIRLQRTCDIKDQICHLR